MKIELQEHHIAEIRDKVDNWPASRLNAKDVRDDCRKLLEHIEAREQRIIDEAERNEVLQDFNCDGCYQRGLDDGRNEASDISRSLNLLIEQKDREIAELRRRAWPQ